MLKHKLWMTAVGMLALTNALAFGDEPTEEMQKPQKFERTVTKTMRAEYLLYLPKGYDAGAAKRWPLMLFLHGAGERGTDLQKVAVHGPPKLVKQKKNFPFIIVSPQCPTGESWSNDVLLGLLEDVVAHYARVRAYLEKRGTPIGPNDLWLAAHALCTDLTVVTGNEREFKRVPGLRVENWLR